MPAKHSRHVALTAALAEWIDAQVTDGHYTSASDVIRAAVRLLKAQDERSAVPIPAAIPITVALASADDDASAGGEALRLS